MNLPVIHRKHPKSESVSFPQLFDLPLFPFMERPLREQWRGPSVDISDTDKDILVRAEIPGLRSDDLKVSYSEGILTIEGEKKEEKENTRAGTTYKESRYGSFRRDIPIGENLNWENSKASYKNGVLTVSIPKKEEAVSNAVKINIE